MSYGPCLCGGIDCPRCAPAQGWHVHSRACFDEQGLPGCGLLADGEAELLRCIHCSARSETEVCPDCQREIEEEQAGEAA